MISYLNHRHDSKYANHTKLHIILFFFSSRRRHTRYIGDWSSDVCSSDLLILAGSRENQSVVATKSGNHDCPGHAHRSWPTEDGVHHCYGYAVMWRVLDFRKRQHRQISNVSQQIKYDHNGAPSDKRAYEIFSRIAH